MNTIVINKVTLNKLLIVISVSLCMFLSISASKADAAAPVVQTRTETVVATPSTTHNITIPAVSTGDLSLVMIGHDNNYVTTTPSGWTKLFETANGGWFSIEAFYKFAPTNAGQTTENFVTTSTTNMAAQAFTITGAGVGRVSAGTTAVYGFLTTTPDPPSLNPGWGSQDTLWFAFASQNQGSTMNSWPANYANNWSSNAGGGSYAHVVRRTLTAASEDPGSFSFSGSWESAANTIAVGPPANTAPTYNTQPYSGYTSTYTRVGPGNTWQAYIWAVDSEQTGANALTWQIRTNSCGAGTLIANGTFTSGAAQYTGFLSYNISGLVDGSNTLYMCISDGTLSTTSSPFTLLRDDIEPTASTTISTTPATVVGNYTVTFTPNDARSTNSNEMSYQIRTASGGGGTLLTSGSANSTSGTPKTTGSITTDTLSQGANTRYVRTCDGANNCTDTSFTVTASTPPSSVTTDAETNPGSYKVTFNGTANPNGSQAYGYFRLYTSAPDCTLNTGGQRFPSLESQDVSIGSGSAGVAFAYTTPPTILLTASTNYWYCAYSRNVAAGSGVPGTPAAGGYETFTTPDGPASGCDAPASGDMTISESCTFPQSDYDGVDNGGSGATNTGRITLASGGNITINPGQRIARGSLITNGGSFSIGNGSGSVIRGGVYLKDSDGDGIIDNPVVKVVANTQPAGYVRRNHLYTLPTYNNSSFNYASKMYNAVATSPSSLDCDQTSANAWRFIPSLVTDTDNDGYKTATAAYQQCVGASSSINERTYYSATASATLWQWLPDAQKLSATTDCQDDPNGGPCAPVNGSGTNGTNPVASAVTTSRIDLAWGINLIGGAVPASTGYDIQICGLNDTTCASVDSTQSVANNVFSYNNSPLGCSTSPSYYYRIVAKSGSGNTNSNIFSGVTSNCASAPSVTTDAASGQTTTTAILNSTINPNGASTNVIYRYGTSNVACSSLPSTLNGPNGLTGSSPLSGGTTQNTLTGLAGNTTYYFCVSASNGIGGQQYGSVMNFTTTRSFYDLFTDTNGVLLENHTPDFGTGWTKLIDTGSGNLNIISTSVTDAGDFSSAGELYVTNNTMDSADYKVSVMMTTGDSSDDYNVIAGRVQDSSNMYAAEFNNSQTRLYKKVSGSWLQLGSTATGIANGSTVTLNMYGSIIEVLDDGVALVSITDTSLSSAGKAGIGMGGVINSTGDFSIQVMDTFEVIGSVGCLASVWYRDADVDGFGTSSTTAACGTAGYIFDVSDCYDSNANAKPGQTSYFESSRGDGSWDYNCNSGVEISQMEMDCCTTANSYGYDTHDGNGYSSSACNGTVYSINQTCFNANVTSWSTCNSSSSYCGKRRLDGTTYYPYSYTQPGGGGGTGVSCPSLIVQRVSGSGGELGYVSCQ